MTGGLMERLKKQGKRQNKKETENLAKA